MKKLFFIGLLVMIVLISGCTKVPTEMPAETVTSATTTSTPTPASTSYLRMESEPSGAEVSVYYGNYSGKKLGVTPFYIDPTAYPSPTYLNFTKPGYNPGT